MAKAQVSISQLAKYGLDYISLISSGASRSRPIKTEPLNNELVPIPEILFGNEVESITINLVTLLDSKFDPELADEEKTDEQIKAERIKRKK